MLLWLKNEVSVPFVSISFGQNFHKEQGNAKGVNWVICERAGDQNAAALN